MTSDSSGETMVTARRIESNTTPASRNSPPPPRLWRRCRKGFGSRVAPVRYDAWWASLSIGITCPEIDLPASEAR